MAKLSIKFDVNENKWIAPLESPEKIFGVTFMAVDLYHPRSGELVTKEQKAEVDFFRKHFDENNHHTAGIFSGSYTENPVNGEQIPIYLSVLYPGMSSKTKVKLGIPAHDQGDLEFAKAYGIRIKQVVKGPLTAHKAYLEEGVLSNSGPFTGMQSSSAKEKIVKWLITKKIGQKP